MHAAVTTLVKFQVRKIARSGPANPHIPGLRRPHTRHTGASALVSLPHDGHRIDPEVLRNITALVGGNAVALVEPHAEIDEAARERAEGAVRVRRPGLGAGAGRGTSRWSRAASPASWASPPTHSRPFQIESYEGPQSVSTRALGDRGRNGFR